MPYRQYFKHDEIIVEARDSIEDQEKVIVKESMDGHSGGLYRRSRLEWRLG